MRTELEIHPTSNIPNQISDGAENLDDTEASHIVIKESKERGLLEVGVLGNFGMEHIHAEHTN